MIRLEKVSKVYQGRDGEVHALSEVDLSVEEGEFLCMKGPSGSGKSTLLLTLGGMVRPTGGKVIFEDKDLYAMPGGERAAFRAEHVGFVFQMFHLVPYLSVIENVLLPFMSGVRQGTREEALALLERFGMTERMRHKPPELSTGERQRAAMARALLNKPKLILADEPTGNLDPKNGEQVMGYLADFQKDGGTVVIVTHEELAAQYAGRTIVLQKGELVEA